MNSSNHPKMKKLVGALEYTTADGEKKSRWTTLGVAFENRDGSWNLRFNYVPTRLAETTIQLRDFESNEKEATSPDDLPL
jgi:hypothetical protein